MRSLVRFLAHFLVLLCLAASLGVVAETVFETIELRYRTPEELLPVLRPLVEPEGTVGAIQNKLVVRTSAQNLRELRKLVAQLDTAPRQLLVTVRQGGDRDIRTRSAGIGGKGTFGDVTVDVPPGVDPTLPGVGIGGSKGAAELRGGTHQSRSSTNGDQQLRVLDGREAVIHVGQEVPYTTKSHGPGGTITETTQFRKVLTGFVVRPRVQDDQVMLDISPRQESLDRGSGGAINVSRMSTSISGRLGEWIDLGAITQQGSNESRRNFSHSSTQDDSNHQVRIKVDLLP